VKWHILSATKMEPDESSFCHNIRFGGTTLLADGTKSKESSNKSYISGINVYGIRLQRHVGYNSRTDVLHYNTSINCTSSQ